MRDLLKKGKESVRCTGILKYLLFLVKRKPALKEKNTFCWASVEFSIEVGHLYVEEDMVKRSVWNEERVINPET